MAGASLTGFSEEPVANCGQFSEAYTPRIGAKPLQDLGGGFHADFLSPRVRGNLRRGGDPGGGPDGSIPACAGERAYDAGAL